MRLLDLFCGAGGAAMGYHQAGFDEIVGVDNKPQSNYPFEFVLADAMAFPLEGFDLIHASPPCQRFTKLNNRFVMNDRKRHPDLIAETRVQLVATGALYVIENVLGAPLNIPTVLCGSMFGLELPGRGYLCRHRLFETNWLLGSLECRHGGRRALGVYGHGPARRRSGAEMKLNANDARQIMQMPWATRDGVAQAIPPAYTKYVGGEALRNYL